MPGTKLPTSYGCGYMENPRNYTYNHMTAVENFHLVKRVMSVKPSIRNQKPNQQKHLGNSNVHRAPSANLKLRIPNQSSQSQFKRLEQHKENQVLLHKMLKIMERPLVTKTTSFQHMQRMTETNFNSSQMGERNPLNRSVQSADSKNRRRPGSSSSKKGKNTPTAGMGPISLNLSQRKREMSQISQENYRMVNSLVQVRPRVPLATALDKWSYNQENMKRNLSCVRYGTPKPLQGLKLRLSVGNMLIRRNSQNSQMSQRSGGSTISKKSDTKGLNQHSMKRRQVVNLVPRDMLAHKPPIQKKTNISQTDKWIQKNAHPSKNLRQGFQDQKTEANSAYANNANDMSQPASRGSRRPRVNNAYDISNPQHLDSDTKMQSTANHTTLEGVTLPPMSMGGADNQDQHNSGMINHPSSVGNSGMQQYYPNQMNNRKSSTLTRKRKTVTNAYSSGNKQFVQQPYALSKNNLYRPVRPVTTQNMKPSAQINSGIANHTEYNAMNNNQAAEKSINQRSQGNNVFQGIIEKTIEDESMHLPGEHHANTNRRQTRTAEGRRRVPQNLAAMEPTTTASAAAINVNAGQINAHSQINTNAAYQIVEADTNSDQINGGTNMFEAPHHITQQLVSDSSAHGGKNSFQQIGVSSQQDRSVERDVKQSIQANQKSSHMIYNEQDDDDNNSPGAGIMQDKACDIPYEAMLPKEYPRLLEH